MHISGAAIRHTNSRIGDDGFASERKVVTIEMYFGFLVYRSAACCHSTPGSTIGAHCHMFSHILAKADNGEVRKAI